MAQARLAAVLAAAAVLLTALLSPLPAAGLISNCGNTPNPGVEDLYVAMAQDAAILITPTAQTTVTTLSIYVRGENDPMAPLNIDLYERDATFPDEVDAGTHVDTFGFEGDVPGGTDTHVEVTPFFGSVVLEAGQEYWLMFQAFTFAPAAYVLTATADTSESPAGSIANNHVTRTDYNAWVQSAGSYVPLVSFLGPGEAGCDGIVGAGSGSGTTAAPMTTPAPTTPAPTTPAPTTPAPTTPAPTTPAPTTPVPTTETPTTPVPTTETPTTQPPTTMAPTTLAPTTPVPTTETPTTQPPTTLAPTTLAPTTLAPTTETPTTETPTTQPPTTLAPTTPAPTTPLPTTLAPAKLPLELDCVPIEGSLDQWMPSTPDHKIELSGNCSAATMRVVVDGEEEMITVTTIVFPMWVSSPGSSITKVDISIYAHGLGDQGVLVSHDRVFWWIGEGWHLHEVAPSNGFVHLWANVDYYISFEFSATDPEDFIRLGTTIPHDITKVTYDQLVVDSNSGPTGHLENHTLALGLLEDNQPAGCQSIEGDNFEAPVAEISTCVTDTMDLTPVVVSSTSTVTMRIRVYSDTTVAEIAFLGWRGETGSSANLVVRLFAGDVTDGVLVDEFDIEESGNLIIGSSNGGDLLFGSILLRSGVAYYLEISLPGSDSGDVYYLGNQPYYNRHFDELMVHTSGGSERLPDPLQLSLLGFDERDHCGARGPPLPPPAVPTTDPIPPFSICDDTTWEIDAGVVVRVSPTSTARVRFRVNSDVTLSTIVLGAWTGGTDLETFYGKIYEWDKSFGGLNFRKHPDFDNLIIGDSVGAPLKLWAFYDYYVDIKSSHNIDETHILLHTTQDRVLNGSHFSLEVFTDDSHVFSEHTLAMALLGPGEDVGCISTTTDTPTTTADPIRGPGSIVAGDGSDSDTGLFGLSKGAGIGVAAGIATAGAAGLGAAAYGASKLLKKSPEIPNIDLESNRPNGTDQTKKAPSLESCSVSSSSSSSSSSSTTSSSS